MNAPRLGKALAALTAAFALFAAQPEAASAILPIHGAPTAVPKISVQPEFDGVAQVGEILTISKGTWKNRPTSYKYQWYTCTKEPKPVSATKPAKCTALGGKTKSTYTAVTRDIGKYIVVSVTGVNRSGKKATFIAYPDPVLSDNVAPVNSNPPVITLDTTDPTMIDASQGDWTGDPTDYAYQWYDCTDQQTATADALSDACTEITDASDSQYQPGADDAGNYLMVGVTATNDNGDSTIYSESTTVTVDVPANTAAPAVTGNTSVGSMLTANFGVWSSLLPDTTTYSWMACTEAQTAASDTLPAVCDAISRRTQVASGTDFACASLPSGRVDCWGANSQGQLGDGSKTSSSKPVAVKNLTTAVDVVAGGQHACALKVDGSVVCWGDATSGTLGNGGSTDSSSPVAVSGLSGVTQIAAGATSTCALLSDQTVKCWGANTAGQLGNGANTQSAVPVAVTGMTTATYISAGDAQACAVLADGTASCWGSNTSGQLGDGSTTNSNVPVSVVGAVNASQIATGTTHSCIIDGSGLVSCWGDNSTGQLGTGDTVNQLTITTPTDLIGALKVSVAATSTCVVMGDGSTVCWGSNTSGQLGDGTTTDSPTPVSPDGVNTASDITISSGDFACAVVDDYKVSCWGNGSTGAYGDGNSTTDTAVHAVSITDDGKLLVTSAEIGAFLLVAVTDTNPLGDTSMYSETTNAIN